MTKIFRYELMRGMNVVEAPAGAIPVKFGSQRGDFFLWLMVDPELPTRTYRFEVTGTGIEIKAQPSEIFYVGGIDLGPFEWHCIGYPDAAK